MDISTVVGFIVGIVGISLAIQSGSEFTAFINLPSIFVIIGGVVAATMIRWPASNLKVLLKIFMKSIFFTQVDFKALIIEIQEMAKISRKESLFALENVETDDAFLKKAITLAADNRPPEVVKALLKAELDAMKERHNTGISMMLGVGVDGPAFGMIGTLISLVQMLQNLSNPASIGPVMAIALLTTFYGAVIGNLFANPVANKLHIRSEQEATRMNIIISGVLSIVNGENPRVIVEKLSSFLDPLGRIALLQETGLLEGGEGDAAGGDDEAA